MESTKSLWASEFKEIDPEEATVLVKLGLAIWHWREGWSNGPKHWVLPADDTCTPARYFKITSNPPVRFYVRKGASDDECS